MRQVDLPAVHEADLQAERLRTLHRIDRGIIAAESVQDIAVGALSRIRDLIPAQRGSIALFDWDLRESIVFASEVDASEVDTTGVHYAFDALGDMLDVLASGEPFVSGDMANEPIPVVLGPFRNRGLRSCLVVPFPGGDRTTGCLSLMAVEPHVYGTTEVEVATEVAAQLAIAIEHQQLRDQRARRAQELSELVGELRESEARRADLLRQLVDAHEEERRVIAAAVHDDAIQKMAVVVMRVDMLEMAFPEIAGDQLEELRASVQETIDELRRLMFELHPYVLDSDGLVAALRAFVKEQTRLGDDTIYEVDVQLRGEPAPEMRAVLFRIAQEAIRNARRHARATTVRISLDDDADGVRLTVADDGVGFDVVVSSESPPGHLGLTAMRERAEMVGGWRRLTSRPGAGTVVEAWVPRAGEAGA
ncbi:MAG TPA: GAF domain-containing sensor histidine kinase [Actinomycetota bacterium]|jgi:signal transduction histidine kinase